MMPLYIGGFLPPPPSPPLSVSRPLNGFPWLKHSSCATKLHQRRSGICGAVELPHDAPFAISIGASMLSSLLFANPSPDSDSDSDGDEDAAITSTDARMAVMTIISFIPYFNWLSWVFALMDSGERRYAVYALVYLAPYFRTNLSLSPEESWLPIASILLCIIHIQLEASVRSGDLALRLGLVNVKKDRQSRSLGKKHEKERRHHNMNLPSGQHQSRDEINEWILPTEPTKDLEHLYEDGGLDD